jgi:prolyl 4-hydroxylase
MISEDPPIYVIDNFCTPAEIELVRQIALIDMQPSETTHGAVTRRTSRSGGAPKWSVEWLTDRVSQLTGWPASHMESIQVTHYAAGQDYDFHYDAPDPVPDDWVGGNRVVTVLVYMNDVERGGGTQFDTVTVLPQAGRAVVFYPSDPETGEVDQRLGHAALPPIDCEKWVMQVWIRRHPTDFE